MSKCTICGLKTDSESLMCGSCIGAELKSINNKESIELLFDLMLKNGVNLKDFILWVFKNKVNNTEYIPVFIDELKRELEGKI